MADTTTPDPTAPAPAATPVPPVEAPASPASADAITTAVRSWQAAQLANTAVSRDAQCWAVVDAAIPALIAALQEV